MTKTPKRDPAFPNPNKSAFQMYQEEMSEIFRERNPELNCEKLILYTETMFERMPFMEKCTWMSKAEDDRNRFMHEMEQYRPSSGYDMNGNLIEAVSPVKSKSDENSKSTPSRKGNRKDPRYPKRALSAYMLYQNHIRKEAKNDPSITFGEIATIASDKFKAMTEEERSEWVLKSKKDKERFDRELRKYKPSEGYDYNGNLIEKENGSGKKRKPRPLKDANSPKRAAGAYVFFANEMRPKLQEENPGVKFVDIGKILGEKWRSLSAEERAPYDKLSSEDKARYRRQIKIYKEQRQERSQSDEDSSQCARTESDESIRGTQSRENSFSSINSSQLKDEGFDSSVKPVLSHSVYKKRI